MPNSNYHQRSSKTLALAAFIAIVTTLSAAAIRLLFLHEILGASAPYITILPAVIISALYGGFYSGLIATVFSAALVNFLWLQPFNEFVYYDPAALLKMTLFIASGISISFISRALNSVRTRVIEAEAEARYAIELKQTVEELYESKSKYKAIIDAFDGLIYICSSDRKLLFMNDRLIERTGYDATGESCFNIVHGLNEPCPWCVRDHVSCGESFRRELMSPKDNRWYETSNSPVYNGDGSISIQAMSTDITERKKTEEALRKVHDELELRVLERTAQLELTVEELQEKKHLLLQQSRLAAMGEVVSNIAHQWRQPLNTLGLLIQKLELDYELGEFNKEILVKSTNDSMNLIGHMSQTIDDFRNFFIPLKTKEDFEINHVIGNAVKLIEASFSSHNITIVQDFISDAKVHGYPNEYAQVILNLLTNAKDAFGENKIVKPVVVITSNVIEGKSVVTVRDNAGGIPEGLLGRIFEPYFTTKGVQGTGIGLFMSKNIIEKNMKGTLTVVNTGDGAQFTISLLSPSSSPDQLYFNGF